MSPDEHPAPEPSPAPETPPADFGKGKKALVIDDDVTSRELIRSTLVKAGFTVLASESGKEGWEQMTPASMPDIIVSDAVMPGMSGLDFFRELRGNDETKNIPVIIISARKNMEDTFLALGANAFLLKPLDVDFFLQQAATFLNAKSKTSTKAKSDEDAAE